MEASHESWFKENGGFKMLNLSDLEPRSVKTFDIHIGSWTHLVNCIPTIFDTHRLR